MSILAILDKSLALRSLTHVTTMTNIRTNSRSPQSLSVYSSGVFPHLQTVFVYQKPVSMLPATWLHVNSQSMGTMRVQ